MSEMLKLTIVNAETGETIERPFTADEITDLEALELEQSHSEAQAQAKADARESALAKLAALGLTQDEINAL
jgi:hypothetical protein